jgi:hypothetical protein
MSVLNQHQIDTSVAKAQFTAAAVAFATAVEGLGVEFALVTFVPDLQDEDTTRLGVASNVAIDRRGWLCAKYLEMLVSDEAETTTLATITENQSVAGSGPLVN